MEIFPEEICFIRYQSRHFLSENGRFRLDYRLSRKNMSQDTGEKNGRYCYGISVWQYKEKGEGDYQLYDFSEANGISDSMMKAELLFYTISAEFVMPVSLYEILDVIYSECAAV